MKPIFVSFYTPTYKSNADELRCSLKQFNLDYDIVSVADTGKWETNCAKKPHIILSAMLKYHTGNLGGRPIVFLDADARVLREPSLFETIDETVDIAYHSLDNNEVLSGTVYFGNTAWAVALARKWCEACRAMSSLWDQRVLEQILVENPQLFKRELLPESYCYIFDREKLAKSDVVIEHLQASRTLRK